MSFALAFDPTGAQTPRRARRACARQLAEWNLEHLTDDVELIASELVTNAQRHGGGLREVRLDRAEDSLRISVTDFSPVPPHEGAAAPTDVSGRGIAMVAALASAWGVDQRTDGKTVWAELPLTS